MKRLGNFYRNGQELGVGLGFGLDDVGLRHRYAESVVLDRFLHDFSCCWNLGHCLRISIQKLLRC